MDYHKRGAQLLSNSGSGDGTDSTSNGKPIGDIQGTLFVVLIIVVIGVGLIVLILFYKFLSRCSDPSSRSRNVYPVGVEESRHIDNDVQLESRAAIRSTAHNSPTTASISNNTVVPMSSDLRELTSYSETDYRSQIISDPNVVPALAVIAEDGVDLEAAPTTAYIADDPVVAATVTIINTNNRTSSNQSIEANNNNNNPNNNYTYAFSSPTRSDNGSPNRISPARITTPLAIPVTFGRRLNFFV
jgi:hypothetical protein